MFYVTGGFTFNKQFWETHKPSDCKEIVGVEMKYPTQVNVMKEGNVTYDSFCITVDGKPTVKSADEYNNMCFAHSSTDIKEGSVVSITPAYARMFLNVIYTYYKI